MRTRDQQDQIRDQMIHQDQIGDQMIHQERERERTEICRIIYSLIHSHLSYIWNTAMEFSYGIHKVAPARCFGSSHGHMDG